jgi:hypothetical protein
MPPVAQTPLLDADRMERLFDLSPAKRRCVRRIRELRDQAGSA